MTTSQSGRNYALRQGVRIFRSGEEIRFRKGVWSYNEATIRLGGQPERVVRFFSALFEALAAGMSADAEGLARDAGASRDELASFCELLDNLKRQQYLNDPAQHDAADVVSALLGGNLTGFGAYVKSPRPVLFFADSEYARKAARMMAGETGLPLDQIDDETLGALAAADLTTRTDAVAHEEAMARFEKLFPLYSCVVGCVASPCLTLLRNLNRLLVRLEKPLILGLIDGPFVSVFSTLATETGCFECFEQRMLARLEDTAVYHSFARSATATATVNAPWLAPPLHLLTSSVLSEAYLYSSLGMLRLSGRIVNIYLPLLEIQVQDLLRVPYCPGCGVISKAQMNEMYTSSKRLVDEMLERIEVEEPQ